MLNRLNGFLLLMGIPGLVAISFIDSAGIPLPGGPDAVILLLSWKKPSLIIAVVLAAALGSTLGCLVLYGIGRKGGEKALARFNPERKAWVERNMRKHALPAIIASVLAPPPFPTKLVILAAGVLGVGRVRFLASIFAGRLIRYSLIGYVGARYGDGAAQIIKEQYPAISLILIGCILLAILIRIVNRSQEPEARSRKAEARSQEPGARRTGAGFLL